MEQWSRIENAAKRPRRIHQTDFWPRYGRRTFIANGPESAMEIRRGKILESKNKCLL